MDKIAKIDQRPDLVKDLKNGAVINVDTAKYLEHKRFMQINKRTIAERNAVTESVQHLNDEINTLKQQHADLKSMLQILIDRK
jgi:transketolase